MVNLVLKDARQPAFRLNGHRAAMSVQSLNRDSFKALHIPLDAWYGEATLSTEHSLLRGMGYRRVSHYIQFGWDFIVLVFPILNDNQAGGFAHLWSSQTHTGSLAHSLHHIIP